MDSIKAGKKLQAMKAFKKGGHHHELVYNFVVYALTAFLSSLFYLYLFCFPSMTHFLFDFVPNFCSFLLSSKFLFLLGNIIVIILLVGESSKKVGASRRRRSSPANEIYDEYIEIRSRTLIKEQAVDQWNERNDQKVEEEDKKGKKIIVEEMDNNNNNEKRSRMIRRNCSWNNVINCVQERKEKKKKKTVAMESCRGGSRRLTRPRSAVEHKQEKKDGRLTMVHENENENENTIRLLDQENIRKETLSDNRSLVMTRPQSLGNLYHMHEISSDHNGDGIGDVASKTTSREEKRKEMENSMDELNRRVEEYIARVNRQRMLEAKELEVELD